MCLCKMSLINDSRTLHKIQVRDTGLKLFVSVLSPFLKMAVISAVFQSSGNIPFDIDLLKRTDSGPDNSQLSSFSALGYNLSGLVI